MRNESQHFSFEHTNSATKNVVKLYFDISLELNLAVCIEEYNSLLKRLNDLALGKNFQSDPNLSNKLSDMEKQKAEITAK